MAGRDRMGLRQPYVKGHEAGLCAEADERKEEADRGSAGRQLDAEAGKSERRAGLAEKEEEGQQEQRAKVRRDEVDPRGAAHLAPVVLKGDEEERCERHRLPGDEEDESVAGQDDNHHGRE